MFPTMDAVYEYDLMMRGCLKVSGLPKVNSSEETTGLEHMMYEVLGDHIGGCYVPKDRGEAYVMVL